jgi:hypothetical protein
VVAGDLVGVDAKPVFGQLAHELHGEEMIPARQQYLRRHVRPRGKRPRLFERRAGLIQLVLGDELRGQLLWRVVQGEGEGVVRARGALLGVVLARASP